MNELEIENQGLRALLWLRHGCSSPALYGDDGNMQCSKCLLDFKKDSPTGIAAAFEKIGRAKLEVRLPQLTTSDSDFLIVIRQVIKACPELDVPETLGAVMRAIKGKGNPSKIIALVKVEKANQSPEEEVQRLTKVLRSIYNGDCEDRSSYAARCGDCQQCIIGKALGIES